MIIYIAGPMTGLKDYNAACFNRAARALRARGHEVRNPAQLDQDWSKYEDYIEVGLVMLKQCDSIVFLPGHEKSNGARLEAKTAKECGLVDRSELLVNVWAELNADYVGARR